MGEVVGGMIDLIFIVLVGGKMAWERHRYMSGQPPGGDLMLWAAVVVLPVVLGLLLVGIWCGFRVVRGDP